MHFFLLHLLCHLALLFFLFHPALLFFLINIFSKWLQSGTLTSPLWFMFSNDIAHFVTRSITSQRFRYVTNIHWIMWKLWFLKISCNIFLNSVVLLCFVFKLKHCESFITSWLSFLAFTKIFHMLHAHTYIYAKESMFMCIFCFYIFILSILICICACRF